MKTQRKTLKPNSNAAAGRSGAAETFAPTAAFEAPAKSRATDRWRVAIHEAGHAVAAHTLGVPLGEITLVRGRTMDGDDYAGLTNLNQDARQVRRALDEYYDCDNDDDDDDDREAETIAFAMKNIQVSYAGKLAEELFFGDGDPLTWHHDISLIHQCAERVCPPDAQELAETEIAISADATYEECLLVASEKAASTQPHEVDHFKTWLECRTRKLVNSRRQLVEVVAKRLLIKKRLSSEEAAGAIQTAMCAASHGAGGRS